MTPLVNRSKCIPGIADRGNHDVGRRHTITIFLCKAGYSWGRRPTLLKQGWIRLLEWGLSKNIFSVWPKFDLWHECCFNVGHSLRHRPYIKQHMSADRVAHRKRLRHRPPHLTETCVRDELMESQRRRQRANIKKTFFEKLMNIQYLNLPAYPNRWMVWLIQQGLAWRPRCVKTCCQEDDNNTLTRNTRSRRRWSNIVLTLSQHWVFCLLAW